MAFFKWIIGGLIGALVGGTIWVLLGYYANVEVGYVAWGIGILVGIGVRYAAHMDGQEDSAVQGILAAGIALGAVMAAKYAVFVLTVTIPINSALSDFESVDEEDGYLMTMLADRVVDEYDEKGRRLNWPTGSSIETAQVAADYPPGIWKEAENRFGKLTDEERAEFAEERKANLQLFRDTLAAEMPTFLDTFSPYDALWIFLAVASAFRLANGSSD